jgi:hypothetical protein
MNHSHQTTILNLTLGINSTTLPTTLKQVIYHPLLYSILFYVHIFLTTGGSFFPQEGFLMHLSLRH